MSMIEYAKSELDGIGMTENSDDEMNRMMRKHILTMVQAFADEGHSGFSASYAVSVLERLLRYEPLSPLTGEESEWFDVSRESGYTLFQNKRCSRVFKDETGAYDIDGKVFVEPNGASFTSRDSQVYITFPYTPKTEYVNVPFSEDSEND